MDAASLQACAGRQMERVFHRMEEALSSDIMLLSQTNASILDGGGKRIRPLLALLSAGASGVACEDTERLAAAAELLHNATLLHDDVVDGAATRRGRPTVMSILNAPASVLVGDFWLARAVELILDTTAHTFQYIRIFSKTLDDLAVGEMLQLEKTDACDTTFDDYIRIIYCKTASLFEAAARCGALSAGAPEDRVEAVAAYARNVGIAFQIKDDILDYEGGDIGKPAGQDLAERKVTLPLLAALETADEDGRKAIRAKLAAGGAEDEIIAFVRSRDGIVRAQKTLEDYIEKACAALKTLPDSPDRQHLCELAQYLTIRKQ